MNGRHLRFVAGAILAVGLAGLRTADLLPPKVKPVTTADMGSAVVKAL